jgi:CRP-like cAMP-binding protein
MSGPTQSFVRNCLLSAIPPDGYRLLQPHLQSMTFDRGMTLIAPMQPIEHVHFLDSGIGSIISGASDLRVETGLFGRDGMSGTVALLGAPRDRAETIVQVAGEGYRLAMAVLTDACEHAPAMRSLLLRYVHVLAVQTSYTALSNVNQSVEERLARWLLMCHDRTTGDEIPLTHEFLAIMLAVRRPSVTTALHVLEGNGFIRSRRGTITVRDRDGLTEFADGTYGVPEEEYRALVGAFG